MKKQIYDEKNGLSYTLHGDYYLPDLEINEEEPTYGKYGIMRKKFLKEHRSARYGKNVQHRLIRRVSMDQFYAILTGEEDAFYKMCMALPEVINSVVNEEGGVEVPHDTVIDELRKVASLYGDENDELSMAMAVYMLGFNTYMGFGDKIRGELGENKDGMLKRIYEYVKRLK